MSSTHVGEIDKGINKTGSSMARFALIAQQGFDTNSRNLQLVLAVANGTRLLADGILDKAVGNNAATYFRKSYVLEGTATSPVNTAAAAVGADVFLDPTTPGAWTLTKPTAAGQDLQRVGTVLTSHATLGRILFKMEAGGVIGIQPGDITSILLNDRPHYDIDRAGIGWLRFTGNVSAGERFTIGTRVYEFTVAGVPSPGTDVAINMGGAGPWAAGLSTTNAVAAINGDASGSAYARVTDAGGQCMSLLARSAGSTGNPALATTAVNGIVSGAALTGGRARNRQVLAVQRYLVTAADVAALAVTPGTSEIPIGSFADVNGPDFISSVQAYRPTGAYSAPIALYATDVHIVQNGPAAAFYTAFYREPVAGALLQANDTIMITYHRNPGTP